MSASLVGSEMCIRDSVPAVRVPGRGGRAWQEEGGQVHHVQVWRHQRQAVSYTHLTLPTICSV
eukprot:3834116-Alexandrium_andersonii.AAC.1